MWKRLKKTFSHLGPPLMLLLVLSAPAYAVDGVIEINQAKAVAGGVTASDTLGFPVTISAAGSYVLTGNLTVPDANTTAIEISSGDVTVDLNGFAIIGPGTAVGSGRGVILTGLFDNITVLNGTIRGMGGDAIRLQTTGIPRQPFGLRVERVRAVSNGLGGILTFDGATVAGNTVGNNGLTGIEAGPGSTVTGNTVFNNGGIGINCGRGCTVIGNSVSGNANFGLATAFQSGYANNVFEQNNGGNANPQVSGGTEMGINMCAGDTVCP